jgi:hypothetical protein
MSVPSVFQARTGLTQYVIPMTKLGVQLMFDSDGFMTVNRAKVTPLSTQTLAQVSPTAATRHTPHFKVVPAATVAFDNGGLIKFE